MELEIRQVKPGDVALFDRVADAVFDEAVDPGRLAAYLAEPGHHMLVALLAGEVVAQVAAVIHRHPDKPTELYIDEVGVTPALQRQGIAGAMLEQMLALGKALGCEEAWSAPRPTTDRREACMNPAAPLPSPLSSICSSCERRRDRGRRTARSL
jgi:GNAT superfamily N-acetyltransferase